MIEYFSTKDFESKLVPGVRFKLRKASKGRRSSFNLKESALLARRTDLQKRLAPIQDEIRQAEDAAKLEPCSCSHALDGDIVAAKKQDIDRLNTAMNGRDGWTKVELIDGCHNAVTKRCLIDGCNCRKAKPDPAVGDYSKYQEVMSELLRVTDEIGLAQARYFVSEVQGLKVDGQDATIDSLIESGPEGLAEEVSAEVQKLLNLTLDESLAFQQPTTGGAAVASSESSTAQPTAIPASGASSTGSAVVASSQS